MSRKIKKKYHAILVPLFFLIAMIALTESSNADAPFSGKTLVSNLEDGVKFVYTADIDGDGDKDVVSASVSTDTITWHENVNGDGSTWLAHPIDSTADSAWCVRAADLDGDGDMDVFSASPADDKIAWYENTNGNGTSWTSHTITTTADGALSVFAVDIDDDGDLDLISGSYDDDTVAWYENRLNEPAHQNFSNQQVISSTANGTYSVYSADMDNDGDTDVVCSAAADDRIIWFENRLRSSQSWISHDIANAVDSVYVVAKDLDADGDIDIVSANCDDNNIAWYENTGGDGLSWAPHVLTGSTVAAYAVFAADIDNDGDIDLLSASRDDNKIAWYENLDGSGTFSSQKVIDNAAWGAWSVHADDMDNDGDMDILAATWMNEGLDTISLYKNISSHQGASFQRQTVLSSTAEQAYDVIAADLNGDGKMDVISVSAKPGVPVVSKIAWYENIDNNGTLGPERLIPHSQNAWDVRSVHSADFDLDGDNDIVVAATNSDTISWFENTLGDGSTWDEHFVTTYPGGFVDAPTAVFASDVDGDGDKDIVSASAFDDKISWFENRIREGESWLGREITNLANSARTVYAVDIDQDGDIDVIAAWDGGSEGSTGDGIAWYENDGNPKAGGWTTHIIVEGLPDPREVTVADLDGDGDLDIICGMFNYSNIPWFENRLNEGLPFQVHYSDIGNINLVGAYSIYPLDMDLDGDIDILSGSTHYDNSEHNDVLEWYENIEGDGSVWKNHVLPGSFDYIVSVYAEDLDGDGDKDALSASLLDDKIAWYENLTAQYSIQTLDVSPYSLGAGKSSEMIAITVTHNGRVGDNALEVSGLNLLFEETTGDPLSNLEANQIIDHLLIYMDDESGTFELENDTLVADIDSIDLIDGIQIITFEDNHPYFQINTAETKTFFVVVSLTGGAANQSSPNQFQLTLLSDPGIIVEDKDNNLRLIGPYMDDITSHILIPGVIIDPPVWETYQVSEDGLEDSYTFVLTSRPAEDVVFEILPDVLEQIDIQPSTITFTAEDWNVPKEIQISAVDDYIYEAEHAEFIIYNVVSNDIDYNSMPVEDILVQISDNELKPTIEFSTSQASDSESEDTLIIGLVLSGKTSQDVSVDYQLSGTATQGNDYISEINSAEIQAGELNGTFLIIISDDFIYEVDESIIVTLINPSINATLGPQSTFEYTILDDDSFSITPSVFPDDYSGGTINPEVVQIVERFSTPTFTIVPADKWGIKQVLVNGGAVELAPDNTYMFPPVEFPQNIYVEFYKLKDPTTIIIDPVELIVLGGPITVSGEVIKEGDNTQVPGPYDVFVTLIPPGGTQADGISKSTTANEVGLFNCEFPCSYIMTAGQWTVKASWNGNDDYLAGAEREERTAEVEKAEGVLNLYALSNVVTIGRDVSIFGYFSYKNEDKVPCRTNLPPNIPLIFTIIPPEGSGSSPTVVLGQTYDSFGHFQLVRGGNPDDDLFNIRGEWIVEVYLVGNDMFFTNHDPVVMHVDIVESAGYAIVVQGKIPDDEEGLKAHNKTTKFVYQVLRERGLLDLDENQDQNNIQYFNYNYDPGAPASDMITLNGMTVPVQIDALPTKANVENAITLWARDRMDPEYIYHPEDPTLEQVGKPANLYIIMIDHGLKDAFYIGENEFGENEVITPTELDGWLDTLQTSLEGTSAQQQEIITMIGACYSGSFIEHIRGPNRVIITSAAGDEVSYRGPKDTVDDEGTVIRDGEYFITEFFKKIRIGKSIKQSFESACALTEIFTSSNVEVYNATSLLRYNDKSRQHPLLEDDNEGPWGSNDLFDPNGDGSNSADLVIGTTYQIVNAYDVVSVNQVANTIFLEEGEDWTDELWATANKQVITVWCEIKPPYFDLIGGGPSQVTMDLDEYLGCFIEEMGRWEWSEENTLICESSQNIGGFTSPGTYQVFCFAKDKIDGAVSDLKTTWVYKAKKGNSAPNSFSLISPVAENSERTTLLLDWEDTNDPDGDTFTYTVLLSGKESEICDGDPSMCICSDDLFENPIRIEGLTNSAYVVTPMDGIRDLHHYCWKVQAIDQYGAITETDFGEFYTEDTNDPRCWVQIFLRDSSTQAPISNATVSVQGGDETITGLGGDHSGFYLGGVQPFPTNTYVVIQAPGYETFTYPADSGNFPSNGEFVRMFDLSVGIDKVAAPSIGPSSQPPGFYLCHQAVELTCATPGATIRYTNDGSEPSSSSPVYGWPIIVRETMTIKARAFKDGYDPSEVLALEYTLSHPVSDLDEEGDVDGVDLALFIHYYNDEDNWADLNGDNAFNEIDISKFAEQFGSVPDSQ